MPKNYKILLYLGAFFIFLIIAYLIVRNLSGTSTNNTGQPTTNLPQYILSQEEEVRVREFVKNFISLYNTYSYEDYSNLTALGDYQTPEMQQKTVELVQNLHASTPIGFAVNTVPDMATFRYAYPSASQLTVSVRAKVTEVRNQNGTQNFSPRNPEQVNTYPVTVNIELASFGKNWLVNNFEIKK